MQYKGWAAFCPYYVIDIPIYENKLSVMFSLKTKEMIIPALDRYQFNMFRQVNGAKP
jgi:hypothetical protein